MCLSELILPIGRALQLSLVVLVFVSRVLSPLVVDGG